MCVYTFSYRLIREESEVFFRFPRFPEIISAIGEEEFDRMSPTERAVHARDAVLTTLVGAVQCREVIPPGEDPALVAADGFVHLDVREAMKLELYKVYLANCRNVAEFAQMLDKPETAARRLLDLHHPSKSGEIEKALAVFGKRLVHDWRLMAA
jgi:hypothetical protein